MKLVFASEFINERSFAAAFARRSRCLAREMVHAGMSVSVVTPEAPDPVERPRSFEIVSLRPCFEVERSKENILQRGLGSIRFAYQFLRLMHRSRPDYVVCAFHYPPYVFSATLVSKLISDAVVFDVHDSWILLENHHPGLLRNTTRKRLERAAMRLATRVTAVSPGLKDLIIDAYGIPPERISVVYNGADMPPTIPKVEKDIDLIHVGSPRVYYDTTAFIETLSVMARSGHRPSVVFLGCREDPYVESVRKMAKDAGLEKHVQFLPRVPPQEVSNWIARSKIGVYTSSHNPKYRCAIGMKVFEYIAYGLPVAYLGPREGNTPELILSGKCGSVSSTPQEFAQTLAEMFVDAKKMRVMGENARGVARRFTWHGAGRELAKALGLQDWDNVSDSKGTLGQTPAQR